MTVEQAMGLPEGSIVKMMRFPNPYLGENYLSDRESVYGVVTGKAEPTQLSVYWEDGKEGVLTECWQFFNLETIGKDETI